MKLYFFIEARIPRYGGDYYLPDMFGEKVLSRYLEEFESLALVCRVHDAAEVPGGGLKLLADKRIGIVPLPEYNGILDYMGKRDSIIKSIDGIVEKGNAYLCRVPGQIGTLAIPVFRKKGVKYAAEVVGDPWEAMSYQAYRSPLSPLLQIAGRRNLLKVTRHADAALYVTEYTLQKKYPVRQGIYTCNASNVELYPENISTLPRDYSGKNKSCRWNFMSVGTLAQMYKAPDIVLKSLSRLHSEGVDFRFRWFGDGQFRPAMERMAHDLGLDGIVEFCGGVSHDRIMQELQDCDILIHASRAEGLPRAVIEAMANALPVIGTPVAGIPELLAPDAIVPVNDAGALASRLEEFIANPELLNRQSAHNLGKAKEYSHSLLSARRKEFYKELKRISQ